MAVVFKHKGNFKNVEKFFKNYDAKRITQILESFGEEGVKALANATPKDTSETANAWAYSTSASRRSLFIKWTNNHVTANGTPIVILLQYGHATRGGGFVQGRDFINPAIAPIFDKIAEAVWQEVSRT